MAADSDNKKDEEQELSEDNDDDMPIASLKKRRRSSSNQQINYAEDDDNDDDEFDDEDDIPLASLAKSPKKAKSKTNGEKKGKAKTPNKKSTTSTTASGSSSKKKPVIKKKESTVSSSGGSKSYEWASMALYSTEAAKGLLIQRLLCRWWYAYDWPDRSKLPKEPPKNYDSLDGFPGVYVCTAGEEVGKILDLRDKTNCPSFRNFAKKPASELKDLLLKALENQKKELIRVEGIGTSTEKEIDRIIKETNKIKPEKADKEAEKVLKAHKLTLS